MSSPAKLLILSNYTVTNLSIEALGVGVTSSYTEKLLFLLSGQAAELKCQHLGRTPRSECQR